MKIHEYKNTAHKVIFNMSCSIGFSILKYNYRDQNIEIVGQLWHKVDQKYYERIYISDKLHCTWTKLWWKYPGVNACTNMFTLHSITSLTCSQHLRPEYFSFNNVIKYRTSCMDYIFLRRSEWCRQNLSVDANNL
jgi:hypothetical protein